MRADLLSALPLARENYGVTSPFEERSATPLRHWKNLRRQDATEWLSEYGLVYGSQRWKSQFSVGSQLRTQLRKQPPQSSSKGNFFVRVRFQGVPSTVEEVVRVRFCCLLCWKTNMGNTGRTVLGHRPSDSRPCGATQSVLRLGH